MRTDGEHTPSRRRLLAGIGTGVAVTVTGCLGSSESPAETSTEPAADTPTEPVASTPTGPVASAPTPATPGDYTYATMGSGDAPVQATYVGNWKCPFCADFSTGFLGDIVTDYVATGDVDITYRGLAYVNGEPFLGADAPRAARAGLAVWNTDPGSYWPFHEHVMVNQPPESEQWATVDRLTEMAREAGVSDPDAVRAALESGEYESAVEATSQWAGEAGVQGTPSLVVGDETVNALQTDQVRSILDSAIEMSSGERTRRDGTESG